MPKRRNEEKIRQYRRKLRKLEKQHRKYNRIVYSSEDSDSVQSDDKNIEPDMVSVNQEDTDNCQENDPQGSEEPSPVLAQEPIVPELDSDILSALGETIEEVPKFGPNIHDKLPRLWLPILKKGLNRDAKEKLIKEYPIPENCSLLQAPKLNPEIYAAVAEGTRIRDKKVETVQQQLGHSIAALNKGLELLLDEGKDRLLAIKFFSDSCRILCDLHHVETDARKRFITPGLDKAFNNIMQDVDRDDLLFGNKLSEKIKATKVIEKQGLQIKKLPPIPRAPPTPSASNYQQYQPSTSRSRPQGNWSGPPRFSSSRGGRAGQRGRGAPVSRRPQSSGPAQQKQPAQNKPPRATGQQ